MVRAHTTPYALVHSGIGMHQGETGPAEKAGTRFGYPPSDLLLI